MVIPKEIRQNVIGGLILDSDGCWRPIDDLLNKNVTKQPLSENTSAPIDDRSALLPAAQQETYRNKETDRLETAVIKPETLADKSNDKLGQTETIQSENVQVDNVKTDEDENLDTKQLRIDSLKPDAPDTKLMKLSKGDIDEFDEAPPKNELEDTLELDSVFSDIMSELDVFSNGEDSATLEKSDQINKDTVSQENNLKGKNDKSAKKVEENTPDKTAGSDGTAPQHSETLTTSKVLSDWDKARSKSGKIILYVSAASAIITGIIVILQILL